MNIKKIVVFLCVAMLPAFANAADTQKTKHKKHSTHTAAQHTATTQQAATKSKTKAHAQNAKSKSKTNAQAGKKSHKKTKHVA